MVRYQVSMIRDHVSMGGVEGAVFAIFAAFALKKSEKISAPSRLRG
jgi:hypothetical protein